ncbi:MAG: HAMP domain-containing sensor histidine kinase [Candidatus Doudnabacteria bacterium]|nr:HAMP domain-containing sensor histidine kinase [Candidatus Doudnabacteria bacterium]
MVKTSKPSGAWATAWNSDAFHRARIKLTLWYMAIILVIVTLFSISFYIVSTRQIQRSFHEYIRAEPGQEENFLEDSHERLAWLLVAIDGTILLIAAFSSYSFAGYTLKPIKQTLEGQKRFVADASHELRTPLAVMRTDIEVLLRQKTPAAPEVKNTLDSVLEEIGNLTHLSSQLLDLSKAEDITFRQNFLPLDLQQLIVGTAAKFQNYSHSRQVELSVEEIAPVKILGNSHFLEHALGNVIENAIKYNKPGGRVRIGANAGKNRAEISITDTGIGIAESDLPLIFERFYQTDQSKHGQGTGLGLSIVKAIIDGHGGFITVRSRLSSGTTIAINLPALNNF